MIAYRDKATIVKPTVAQDRYGGETYDYENPAEVIPIDFGCAFLPTGSTEDMTGRTLQVSGYHLVTPPGKDIPLAAVDRIRWRDLEAEVIGEVSRWPHPVKPGGVHHVEAQLKVVDG